MQPPEENYPLEEEQSLEEMLPRDIKSFTRLREDLEKKGLAEGNKDIEQTVVNSLAILRSGRGPGDDFRDRPMETYLKITEEKNSIVKRHNHLASTGGKQDTKIYREGIPVDKANEVATPPA